MYRITEETALAARLLSRWVLVVLLNPPLRSGIIARLGRVLLSSYRFFHQDIS
ncbi:MAG: hypothetical protein U7123_14470 [Potamolinea sp.]